MNIDDILDILKFSSQFGHILSIEKSIILHNALLILQNENHFWRVFFWGRINGTHKDYYIAYGYRNDILLERTYYYSTNCIDWRLLPTPTENFRKLTLLCHKFFKGDPTLVRTFTIEVDETTTLVKKLKEEDRLSATIHLINDEAMLVPRGGIFKRPDGVVVENAGFEGLNDLEAREIGNFLHFRVPTQKWNTNLLTRDDYNFALDFLDPLDIDVPERCWVINLTDGDSLVTVKSLYWPGLYFYHYLKTPNYGCVYIGNGIKTLDVPFLVSSLEPNIDFTLK